LGPQEPYAGEWKKGARDTDNYLFATRRFYYSFLSFLSFKQAKRDREDTKIKSRSGQTERYTADYDVAIVILPSDRFRILNIVFNAARPRSIELHTK